MFEKKKSKLSDALQKVLQVVIIEFALKRRTLNNFQKFFSRRERCRFCRSTAAGGEIFKTILSVFKTNKNPLRTGDRCRGFVFVPALFWRLFFFVGCRFAVQDVVGGFLRFCGGFENEFAVCLEFV